MTIEIKHARLSVIVPVFNEEKTIETIVDRLQAIPEVSEILIVDDGSTDHTKEILQSRYSSESKIHLLSHERNQGKGYAIRTALKQVRGDVVVIQDADLEYDPAELPSLLRPIACGKADVVYGSRNLGKENKEHSYFSFYWGGIFLSWLANLLYGIRITDEATGYKAFRTSVLRSIDLRCRRFEFCPEVTAKISKRKIPIMEVPIRYNPRRRKEGKKITWKDGAMAIWILFRYRFSD